MAKHTSYSSLGIQSVAKRLKRSKWSFSAFIGKSQELLEFRASECMRQVDWGLVLVKKNHKFALCLDLDGIVIQKFQTFCHTL